MMHRRTPCSPCISRWPRTRPRSSRISGWRQKFTKEKIGFYCACLGWIFEACSVSTPAKQQAIICFDL
ncbi:MAG: hypothetical protein D3904_11040 [Candidatus Electrothrix sp. EH2]|nr:hypothetical protein [Candidatus Electrothrix sp. EH2]